MTDDIGAVGADRGPSLSDAGLEASGFSGAVFDLSPNPYVVMTPALTVVAANRAYETATGSRRDEIIGRPLFDAFPSEPDNVRQVRESLLQARDGKAPHHLALVRYDMPVASDSGHRLEERYWSATHVPILDDRGEVVFLLQHTVDVTELHNLRTLSRPGDDQVEMGVVRRAAEVQKTNTLLLNDRRRMRELFRQAPGFMCVLDGPEHRFELSNHAYDQLIGHRDLVGKPLRDALPELAGQGYFELLDQVYATGEPFVGRNMVAQLQRTPGAPLEEVYLDILYQPIVGDDGAVTGIFVEGADVTDQRASERALMQSDARLRLMLDELNHRVKNTIATVQSIAAQTGRTSQSVDGFVEAFNARLVALSHTHNALTRGNWAGADLRQIIEPELRPYADDTVSLDGPPVVLSPRTAVTLGMCFHELATNAAKYGALSVSAGRVDVTWSVETAGQHRRLILAWRESGGPVVNQPSRRGFGSKLIDRSVTGELSGEATMDFAPSGLICSITFLLEPAE